MNYVRNIHSAYEDNMSKGAHKKNGNKKTSTIVIVQNSWLNNLPNNHASCTKGNLAKLAR